MNMDYQLQEIKQFFETNNNYPELKNGCELIQNGKRFVESHISYLEQNQGNQRYKPYYDRLLKYYNYVKNI